MYTHTVAETMCFCTIKMKLEIPVGLRKTMNNVENEK
jgi:hypothetical protein